MYGRLHTYLLVSCCCDAMAAAQPPWPPPGSPQFAGVRDAWRDATLAEWFLHHPQGKALFRIWAAMQRARWQSPPSGAGAAGAPRAAPAGAPHRPAPSARPEAARAPDAARAGWISVRRAYCINSINITGGGVGWFWVGFCGVFGFWGVDVLLLDYALWSVCCCFPHGG